MGLKLVIGQTEVEEARRKEKELEEARKLIETKGETAKVSLKLQEKEEFNLELQTKYNSIKEELEDKTRRIKILQQKIHQLELVNKETHEFMAKEIQDLQIRKREILQEIKLKQFIVEYFISPKFLETMQIIAFYNEPTEEWTIQGLDYSGKMIKNQIQQALQEQQQINATDLINSEEKLQEFSIILILILLIQKKDLKEKNIQQLKKKTSLKSVKGPKSAKKRLQSKRIESAKKRVNLQQQNYPKTIGLSSK